MLPTPGVYSNSCPLSWWCHPISHLALLLPPSIFPNIRVFSNESVLRIRWSKYWSFSFSISTSNEYSGLISFRMDWLDLLAVQGTLKSLLQHQSSKASILQCSAFVIVQLSHPYMTIGKTIALTRWDFHLVAQYFKEANSFHLCSVFSKVSFNLGLAFLVFTRCSPTARMRVTFFLVQAEWLWLTWFFWGGCYRFLGSKIK